MPLVLPHKIALSYRMPRVLPYKITLSYRMPRVLPYKIDSAIEFEMILRASETPTKPSKTPLSGAFRKEKVPEWPIFSLKWTTF